MRKNRTIGAALLGLACCGMLAGCGSQDRGARKTAPLSAADQIRAIQNDPKMPPAAKSAAIQSLQQGQARGAAIGQMQKGKK